MNSSDVQPLVEVTRGPVVESIHFGAIVISDATGRVVAAVGNPQTVTFLRSSAKPFQILPFVEQGGLEHFGLTDRELALMCASHHGTDEHVRVLRALQAKIGISEADLLCGIHPPEDKATARRMIANNEANSPLRHNCSGKHSGMLAFCKLRGWPTQDYIYPLHPLQQTLFQTFCELCGIPLSELKLGTDGCSAPVFAVPMQAAARAFALLADPSALPEPRAVSLRRIFNAVTANPDMIAAPGALDTELMLACAGKVLIKSGAEGYLAMALLPGACAAGSPAYGITIKVSDGDLFEERARATIAVEVLRQLGALPGAAQVPLLSAFDRRPQYNWRHMEVGEIRPVFKLPLP